MKTHCKAAVLIVAIACLLVPCGESRAQLEYYAPVGVRGYGMASTGSADASDVANAVLNPALLATRSAVGITSFYSTHSFEVTRLNQAGFALAGGYGIGFDNGIELRGGLGVAHYKWEVIPESDDLIVRAFDEDSPYVMLAGGVGYKGRVVLAVGATFKQHHYTTYPPGGPRSGHQTIHDVGVIASAEVANGDYVRVSATVGFSWLNNGDEVDIYILPDPIEPFAMNRWGLHIDVEGPAWSTLSDAVDSDLPIAALAINWDIEETDVTGRDLDRQGAGMELAVLESFFWRLGYLDNGIFYPAGTHATSGLGVGFARGGFRVRIDWARSPYLSRDFDYYGLTVDLLI